MQTAAMKALETEEITRRLSGSRPQVAAFVRQAAEAGSTEAQARLGQMLLDGDGVLRDEAAAFAWFGKAARAGHLEGGNMLGRCYDLGWGTAVDKVKAALWFRAAATRGLAWGMYNYATLLALGQGVAEDKPQALAWFRKAAAAGNAKAINFIGSFHEDGWAVPRNVGEAARCYASAAAGGDFRGQFNHARMLLSAGDVEGAACWIERAWAGGNQRFRDQLGGWLGTAPPELRTRLAMPRFCD